MTHSGGTNVFPSAAQPDIVRSVQKDNLCYDMLESSLTDVVQGLLGPAAVFRHRAALRTLASLLYYGSSTGAALCVFFNWSPSSSYGVSSSPRYIFLQGSASRPWVKSIVTSFKQQRPS